MNGWVALPSRDATARINLYASTDKAYHTLQLFVDDKALEVVQIVMKGREGMRTL